MIHALLLIVSTTTVDPTTVAVVPVCDALRSSESAAWMALALSEQGWQVVPAADEGTSRPCVEHNLRRLKATFREARALFEEQLRHEAAKLQLNEAAQVFERHQTLFGAPNLFAKVHFYLGWIAFEAGRREEARRHFARVAGVAPEWRASPHRFPPPVVAAFAQTSSRVQASLGTLAVEASPVGAEVWVDDNKRCQAPCTLAGLAAGSHFVAVRRDGFASHLARVTIEPNATAEVRVELRADARERLASLLEAGDEAALVEVAWSLGPGALVLLAPAPRGQVTLVATGSALAQTRTWTVEASRDVVADAARSLGSPPLSPDSPPETAAEEEGLWLVSRWWFWTAIGAVAVTGVAIGATTHRNVHFTVRP